MDNDAAEGLAGLIAFFLILALIVQIIIWIVQVTVMLVVALIAIGGVLLFFAAIGIGANLFVRALIGSWGDQAGDRVEVIAYRARLGIVMMILAPAPIVTLGSVFLTASSAAPVLWTLISVVSVPAYYGAWWVEEISYNRRKFDMRVNLPFKTEAAMRAEEKILYTRMLIFASSALLGARLFNLSLFGGEK